MPRRRIFLRCAERRDVPNRCGAHARPDRRNRRARCAVDRAIAAANTLAALPPATFAMTKRQLRLDAANRMAPRRPLRRRWRRNLDRAGDAGAYHGLRGEDVQESLGRDCNVGFPADSDRSRHRFCPASAPNAVRLRACPTAAQGRRSNSKCRHAAGLNNLRRAHPMNWNLMDRRHVDAAEGDPNVRSNAQQSSHLEPSSYREFGRGQPRCLVRLFQAACRSRTG